jgi:uncharacterized membrane protein
VGAARSGKAALPARLVRALRSRPRHSLAALAFVAAGAGFFAAGIAPLRAVLAGFDVAALLFLILVVHLFAHADVAAIRRRARIEDAGRRTFLWTNIAFSVIVLLALAQEVLASRHGSTRDIVLAAASLLLSWLYFNTIFALHYAHGYYGDSGRAGSGLEFPGNGEPDYWDFVYFAVTIGMTFQVSDVQVSERGLRRQVAVHALIAFFFNVVILALAVNIAAGRA